MTSAPKSDRIVAAAGPGMKLASSTTFKPEKMFSSAIKSPCRKIESACNSTLMPDCSVSGALASPELRSALRKKSRCSFFLVFGPRANRKKGSFQEQALREARIQSFVYRLDGILHADGCVGNELVEKSFNPRDQVRARNDFVHQADAIGFLRADDFAGQNELQCATLADQPGKTL